MRMGATPFKMYAVIQLGRKQAENGINFAKLLFSMEAG